MIATEQTKWFTEGGIPSNGQVVGVHVAGVQTAEDDPATVGQVYDLFELRADQVVLSYGVEVRTPTAEAGTFQLTVDGTDALSAAAATETAGVTEADAITIAAGAEAVLGFKLVTAGTDVATTLDVSVWAIVADISNPTTIRTTVETPAP